MCVCLDLMGAHPWVVGTALEEAVAGYLWVCLDVPVMEVYVPALYMAVGALAVSICGVCLYVSKPAKSMCKKAYNHRLTSRGVREACRMEEESWSWETERD